MVLIYLYMFASQTLIRSFHSTLFHFNQGIYWSKCAEWNEFADQLMPKNATMSACSLLKIQTSWNAHLLRSLWMCYFRKGFMNYLRPWHARFFHRKWTAIESLRMERKYFWKFEMRKSSLLHWAIRTKIASHIFRFFSDYSHWFNFRLTFTTTIIPSSM